MHNITLRVIDVSLGVAMSADGKRRATIMAYPDDTKDGQPVWIDYVIPPEVYDRMLAEVATNIAEVATERETTNIDLEGVAKFVPFVPAP